MEPPNVRCTSWADRWDAKLYNSASSAASREPTAMIVQYSSSEDARTSSGVCLGESTSIKLTLTTHREENLTRLASKPYSLGWSCLPRRRELVSAAHIAKAVRCKSVIGSLSLPVFVPVLLLRPPFNDRKAANRCSRIRSNDIGSSRSSPSSAVVRTGEVGEELRDDPVHSASSFGRLLKPLLRRWDSRASCRASSLRKDSLSRETSDKRLTPSDCQQLVC